MDLYRTFSEQIEKLRELLSDTGRRYPSFRNLVFKGGGMRGAAYIGVLEVLGSEGILDEIERVAGTSSGALTAILVSLRRDLDETLELIGSVDISRVPQRRSNGTGKGMPLLKRVDVPAIGELTADMESANRFLRRFGWYSSEYVHGWLQDVIGRYFDSGRATFADFRSAGCRDLYVVASNLSRRRSEVFSADTTPDVAVADAARLSMTIPLFFEALRFDGESFGSGDYYVDGGVFDNYPMHIFDAPEFSKGSSQYRNGINWETLGCYLYPARDIDREYEHIEGLMSYMKAVVSSLYSSHQVASYDLNPFNQQRTIRIDDQGVDPTDFSIRRGDELYEALIESGRKATREYLKYELDMDLR